MKLNDALMMEILEWRMAAAADYEDFIREHGDSGKREIFNLAAALYDAYFTRGELDFEENIAVGATVALAGISAFGDVASSPIVKPVSNAMVFAVSLALYVIDSKTDEVIKHIRILKDE